jgi:hypothetical protein
MGPSLYRVQRDRIGALDFLYFGQDLIIARSSQPKEMNHRMQLAFRKDFYRQCSDITDCEKTVVFFDSNSESMRDPGER